ADPVGVAAPVTAAGDEPARHVVRAPTVGVFYRAPEPGAKPFVAEGDIVQPGQQVGIVEAMKLMIPVHADAHGTVVEVLRADGAPVEYDEPLLALSPLDG
ncbi:acetyl-CoA carboxylase biotin carboxyl carrier protein, partial [Micromonospora maritima]